MEKFEFRTSVLIGSLLAILLYLLSTTKKDGPATFVPKEDDSMVRRARYIGK